MISEVFTNGNISVRLTGDTVSFGVRYPEYSEEYIYLNFLLSDLNKVIGLLEEAYEYSEYMRKENEE